MHHFLEFFVPQINQQLKSLKIGTSLTYFSENDHLFGILTVREKTVDEKRYHVIYFSKDIYTKQNLQDQLNLDLVRIFYNEYNQLKKTTSNFDFEIAKSQLHNITLAVRNPFLMLQIDPSKNLDRKIYDFGVTVK